MSVDMNVKTCDYCLQEGIVQTIEQKLWRFWKIISGEEPLKASLNICEECKSIYDSFATSIEKCMNNESTVQKVPLYKTVRGEPSIDIDYHLSVEEVSKEEVVPDYDFLTTSGEEGQAGLDLPVVLPGSTNFQPEPKTISVCSYSDDTSEKGQAGLVLPVVPPVSTNFQKEPETIPICSYSDKTLIRTSNSKGHIWIYAGNKPLACSDCDKCFSTSERDISEKGQAGLVLPVVPSGSTNFQKEPEAIPVCPYSDETLIGTSNSKDHVWIYAGNKPLACSDCDKCFSTSERDTSEKGQAGLVLPVVPPGSTNFQKEPEAIPICSYSDKTVIRTSEACSDCDKCFPTSDKGISDITVRNCVDVIDFLLNTPFDRLSADDQIFLKESDRPQPNLESLVYSSGHQIGYFSKLWYGKCKWLTGSHIRNKLFCWPCLLFPSSCISEDVWSKAGYNDIKNLSQSIENHSRSKSHIASNCKYTLFNKQNENIRDLETSAHRLEIEKYNILVKKNREIVKRLVDVTLFLGYQGLPFRGHDKREESSSKGTFRELVRLMNKHDQLFQNSLDDSFLSGMIQNDLLDSICFVVLKEIDNEIEKVDFISWQVDEMTDVTCKAQLSVIFRYVREGTVVERFVGFYDVSSGRTAEDIFKLLSSTFSKYQLEKKLIAQTYDGAVVTSSNVEDLQTQIKSIAPMALFTHCYAHCLNLVLSDSCKSIKAVRIFFASVSGFHSFFSKYSKHTTILDRICRNRFSTTAPTRWNFTTRVVSTLFNNKSKLVQVFDEIINNSDFDSVSIREATNLRTQLSDTSFLFLLETFDLIFRQSDAFSSIIQNKFNDIVYCTSRLQTLIIKLKEFRTNEKYFNRIFRNTFEKEAKAETKRPKLNDNIFDSAEEQTYRQIYFEILDIVIGQIEIRFADFENLIFFDLLSVDKFETFTQEFPDRLFKIFTKQYGSVFDVIQLKNELSVLYSDNVLSGSKTPHEMLQYMVNSNLQNCLPQLYKLISLIVTIPVTSASTERRFSGLKRIKTCSRNKISQDRLSNISIISIEKKFVQLLFQNERFYDQVVDHFADQKVRTIPLIYKQI